MNTFIMLIYCFNVIISTLTCNMLIDENKTYKAIFSFIWAIFSLAIAIHYGAK